MDYIEAPDGYTGERKSLFMAGGITGCSDWQQGLIDLLRDEDLVLLNPRRKHFPMDDPDAAAAQIRWEYRHLRKADAVSFWFPDETLCPITLYELGSWSMTAKPLFLGVHPGYLRRSDVEIQMRLVRPDVKIAYDIKTLSEQIKGWARRDLAVSDL